MAVKFMEFNIIGVVKLDTISYSRAVKFMEFDIIGVVKFQIFIFFFHELLNCLVTVCMTVWICVLKSFSSV